ncbi:MAG: cytochrome c oxidase assembly protein [Propylenella sp.]
MSRAKDPVRNTVLAVGLMAFVAGMVGLSYAAVPLYRIFCEVTGYGGATQRASAASDRTLERRIVVRFDGNVSGLPWSLRPEVPQVELKLGETALVNFVAESTSGSATTGAATFNVQPSIAGVYFNKIECFCFTEQRLEPGERLEMPVQFFVSPEFADDRELLATRTITLSYTFFPVAGEGQPVARANGDAVEKSM